MRYFYMGTLVPASVIIPLFIAFRFYRRLEQLSRIILLYLLAGGITNVLANYLAERNIPNLYLVHIFACVEFVLVCFFFRTLLMGKRFKKWLPVAALVYVTASACNTFFLQDTGKYNTYALSVSAIVTMALCLYYYKIKLAAQETYSLRQYPAFWYVTGLLIYFSSSLFLFIMSNFTFIMTKSYALILWDIHATMVLIMYLLFATGFWYAKNSR